MSRMYKKLKRNYFYSVCVSVFACMHVCSPHALLVSMEAGESVARAAVSLHVSAGN